MNCPTCQHANPADAHFCANCGVKVVAHTGDHASIAGLVNDSPTEPASVDTVPLDAGSPLVTTAPYDAGPSTPGPYDAGVSPTLGPGRKSSTLPVVLTVAAVAAIVVMGAVLVLSGGRDDSVASVTSDDPATSTDAPTADPALGDTSLTTAATAVPVPATEVPTTAVAPDTLATDDDSAASTPDPATTVAPTSAPPSPGTDPAAVPPIPPEPGPINAPGSPQVLANVSPSGLPYSESAAPFAVAQEFGDALALQNWDLARALSPELASNSDEDFARGYANTNRVSLILVDARPAGSEIELLVVSVAVEIGGSQTSLYCLHWNVEPNARTVRQVGGSRIAQWQANAQPEAIRNDADALATVSECTWP